MASATGRLAAFAANVRYEKLRPAVRHQCTRLIYDTLICTVAGQGSASSEIFEPALLSLGGNAQASIIPSGAKTSVPHAAFLNTMSANARDLDDNLLYHCHIGNSVIPAAVAAAEFANASGRELIAAVAAGYEVASRVTLSVPGVLSIEPKTGHIISTNPVGSGHNCIGAAVAVGRILRLKPEEMAHTLGLAAYSAPIPSLARGMSLDRFSTAKVGMFSWHTASGCLAALLAANGVKGDDRVFEGPGAYWKMNSAPWVDMDVMTNRLGAKWWLMDVSFKLEAAGTWMRPAIQALRVLMAKHTLSAEEIDQIDAYVRPLGHGKLFHQTQPESYLDAQVSYHYLLAATALGISTEEWQQSKVYKSKAIREMIERIHLHADAASEKELHRELSVRPHRATGSLTTVKVRARGKTLVETTKYGPGDPHDRTARASDADLDKKFCQFAAPILRRKAAAVPRAVWALEEGTSARSLVRALCLKQTG